MTTLYRIAEGDCTDEHGRDLSGMTATIVQSTMFYAHVTLTCHPGVTVRVLRSSLVEVDTTPESAAECRARLAWELGGVEAA